MVALFMMLHQMTITIKDVLAGCVRELCRLTVLVNFAG